MSTRVSTLSLFAVLVAAAPGALAQEGSPAGPVPADALEDRRTRLMDRARGVPIVIGASRLKDLEHEYPQDSDFRQTNDFFYLTGLETPKGWLVLNLPEAGSQTLFLEPRDPSQELWTGRKLGPGPEAQRLSGIQDVRSSEEFTSVVRGWFGSSGAEMARVDPGEPQHVETLREALGSRVETVESTASDLAALRLVKDEDELRRLREAVAITSDAHLESWRFARPGVHEYEVEAIIEYVFRSRGAERLGFPSIVGSGENSVTLHYDKNRRLLEDGDLVVVDIGAEYGYYTADLTRTFPVSGTFTDRQREIYDLVLSTQQVAIEAVRPGVTMSELYMVARQHMEENSGDLCGDQSCTAYFPHGLTHWLGMDVHDVGDYGRPLEPGMVFTIEPGIYLPDENLGVRIEDDVLVTETGYELLSASLPRSADEIERIMTEEPVRAGAGAER